MQVLRAAVAKGTYKQLLSPSQLNSLEATSITAAPTDSPTPRDAHCPRLAIASEHTTHPSPPVATSSPLPAKQHSPSRMSQHDEGDVGHVSATHSEKRMHAQQRKRKLPEASRELQPAPQSRRRSSTHIHTTATVGIHAALTTENDLAPHFAAQDSGEMQGHCEAAPATTAGFVTDPAATVSHQEVNRTTSAVASDTLDAAVPTAVAARAVVNEQEMPGSVLRAVESQPPCTIVVPPGGGDQVAAIGPGGSTVCGTTRLTSARAIAAAPLEAPVEDDREIVRPPALCAAAAVDDETALAQAAGERSVSGGAAAGVGGSGGVGGHGESALPEHTAVNEAVSQEQYSDEAAGAAVNESGAGVSGVHGGGGEAAADKANASGEGQGCPCSQGGADRGVNSSDRQFKLGFLNALMLCAGDGNDPEIVLAMTKLNKAASERLHGAFAGAS